MTVSALGATFREVVENGRGRAGLVQLLDLSGRAAIITGGGGPGLGRGCADRLARQGASVLLADVSDQVEDVAMALRRSYDVPVVTVVADVTSDHGVQQVMLRCREELGSVDILVNNVGGGGSGVFVEQSMEEVLAIVDRNLVAALRCTHAAARIMVAQSTGGAIVNVASTGAYLAWTGTPIYGACKAAIISLTANLAQQLAGKGVRVNAISPGTLASDRSISVLEHPDQYPEYVEAIARSVERIITRRPATAEEIADVVVFLASDAASGIHGVNWEVAGGMA
ncbi:MAG: putative 2-hydroxycyclohexanecarboxyl-CoA dehydrogenase [Acidimicrobiaceae bacterium]|nr:putative 2-hydroxycyclohexanecarboxyl-CoA dehydrogenase [Acidimicrobiaceae bacterium]